MDDLTLSPGQQLGTPDNDVAWSFKLLYRDLQGQEQLDISKKDPSNGYQCGEFIYSYTKGTTTSCNNWGNIDCFKFWNNPGLPV